MTKIFNPENTVVWLILISLVLCRRDKKVILQVNVDAKVKLILEFMN